MTSSPRMSLVRFALLAGVLFACLAPAASAAQWPGYGGDAGRSGAQPVDAGAAPVTAAWKRAGNVRTPMLVSGGRVIYGTADGVVHFRRLSDGAPVGGADVGDDADVFGPAGNARASVGFVETGQLFVAHNQGAGIEIAHFDTAAGRLVKQFAVPNTTGLTLQSSLLATPSAADGSRSLFFVAGGRLYKVPVRNAGRADAAFGTVTRTFNVNATPVASPALLSLDVMGTPTPHVAVGTTNGFLLTFRVSNLAPGAFADLTFPLGPGMVDADDVMTPSVPVQPDGGLSAASPFVYVAASGEFPFFPPGVADTIAYKLHVVDGALDFQGEFLPIPDTDPAPALAVSQLLSTTDPELVPEGEVLIPTSTNLFLATTHDMDLTGEIDFNSALVAGEDGFRQSAAATSGPLYYATNDRGQQVVGRLSDGKPLPAHQFARDGANAGADGAGVGQPAISGDHVAFGGPDGVFVYRATRATPPSHSEDAAPEVSFTRPDAGARLSGTPTLAADASDDRGIASVHFLAGERTICTDTVAPYDCAYPLTVDDVGRTTLTAVATDSAGQTASAVRTVNVDRFTPRSLSATTVPSRDRRRPFRFTTSGRLRLPAAATRAQACGSGDVVIQVKAGRKTISTRHAKLGRSCTYRSRVTFRSRNRFPRSGKLTVRVRFLGNAVLAPRRAKNATLRTRP